MGKVTRLRRTALLRAARELRQRGQANGWSVTQTAGRILQELPEITALEAWRLAAGWTRQQALDGIARVYTRQQLRPPPVTTAMLCRWEHAQLRPSAEYLGVLCALYHARPDQLGFGTGPGRVAATAVSDSWYAPVTTPGVVPLRRMEEVPRTDRAAYFWLLANDGLPSLRESLELTLEAEGPAGGPLVHEQFDQAVEFYALVYSAVDATVLFAEVSRCRRLAVQLLNQPQTSRHRGHLRVVAGWLSALLGNLAFHLSDYRGARAHLATAHQLGASVGDMHLVAWSRGAQSMVAWFQGDYQGAAALAADGIQHARTPLIRAQLLAWGQLRALSQMGQRGEALQILGQAADALAADPVGQAPGRFGFDLKEFELHAAEACVALGQLRQAEEHASASRELRDPGTPGWGDTMLVSAIADAQGRHPVQAAERAISVLEVLPAARLRETNRQRLHRLDQLLVSVDLAVVRTFREQLRALPTALPPPPATDQPIT